MVFGSYYHGSGYGRDQQDQINHLQRENQDLQSQVNDYRQREDERQERERCAAEERRREMKERAEEAQYNAEDWPEAFAKQLPRFERELAETIKFNQQVQADKAKDPERAEQFPEYYRLEDPSDWERWIADCKQGRELYQAAQTKYAGKRQEIMAMLERLDQDLLNEVAAQVRALNPKHNSDLAECLEQNDPEKWLYW